MRYRSTLSQPTWYSFKEAVLSGLAPDGGLYVPESIPELKPTVLKKLDSMSLKELAYNIAHPFCEGELNTEELQAVIAQAFSFPIPLKHLGGNIYVLELFHGPTLAFKDFGARFMAGVMGKFVRSSTQPLHILVATSGDTGGAVANAFLGVPGIKVHILFPSKRISTLQELQLTTLGENICAYEVRGNFDDCQRMVKEAFACRELRTKASLASANSINIARLLPQSFYYLYAYAQLLSQTPLKPIFVVPSGNLGNLCGGIIAARMVMRDARFVVATNANDILPQFLNTGEYCPRASQATLSSAMDVGNPSNFSRLRYLLGDDAATMRRILQGQAVSDEDTRKTISQVWQTQGYLLDPHTAVGLCAASKLKLDTGKEPVVVLSTAHPAKFPETYTSLDIFPSPVHPHLETLKGKAGKKIAIEPTLNDLQQALNM